MDTKTVLQAFHAQMRRCPAGARPGYLLEREPGIVRLLSDAQGSASVVCAELSGLDVDAVIATQIARFDGYGGQRGYRCVQVDANDKSRPILMQLGFAELCKTTPYIHRPA